MAEQTTEEECEVRITATRQGTVLFAMMDADGETVSRGWEWSVEDARWMGNTLLTVARKAEREARCPVCGGRGQTGVEYEPGALNFMSTCTACRGSGRERGG